MVPNRATQHRSAQEKVTIGKNGLGKTAPAVLLKSLSVINNLLEIFQEINRNSFEYKKPHWEVVAQAYNWRRYLFGGGVIISYNCNTCLASQNFRKIKVFFSKQIKNKSKDRAAKSIVPSHSSHLLCRRKANGGKWL